MVELNHHYPSQCTHLHQKIKLPMLLFPSLTQRKEKHVLGGTFIQNAVLRFLTITDCLIIINI